DVARECPPTATGPCVGGTEAARQGADIAPRRARPRAGHRFEHGHQRVQLPSLHELLVWPIGTRRVGEDPDVVAAIEQADHLSRDECLRQLRERRDEEGDAERATRPIVWYLVRRRGTLHRFLGHAGMITKSVTGAI